MRVIYSSKSSQYRERNMAQDTDARKEVLASDILEDIKNGKSIKYDNVVINGDINISEHFLAQDKKHIVSSFIKIKNSEVSGSVDFSNIIFKNHARLKNIS